MDRVDDIHLAVKVAQHCYGQTPRVELIPSHYNAVFRLWLEGGPRVLKLAKRTPERASTRKELFIFGKLAEHGVPVPTIEHQDPTGREVGYPFFIMSSAGDQTVADFVHHDDERARRLVRSMGGVFALIHGVTFDQPGQIVHDRVSPVRNPALERKAFEDWCQRLIDEIESRGLLEAREIKVARRTVGYLPPMQGTSLCHGDFHAAQCILNGQGSPSSDPRISAVVDWEAASAGDPVYDYADHHVYMENAYHPSLIASFREGYEAVRPLPRDYDRRYLPVRMIHQLVLIRTFHRRIEPDRVRKGIERYRRLAAS